MSKLRPIDGIKRAILLTPIQYIFDIGMLDSWGHRLALVDLLNN